MCEPLAEGRGLRLAALTSGVKVGCKVVSCFTRPRSRGHGGVDPVGIAAGQSEGSSR